MSDPERGQESSNTGRIEKLPQPVSKWRLSRVVSGIDDADATARYHLEADDNEISSIPNSNSSSVSSPRKIIHWNDGDPENPYNWSGVKKAAIVVVGMAVVVNSTMGSALPSNAMPQIAPYFHITSATAEVLPISIYLVGYVLGPLLFGPLSEQYGRKIIMMSSFLIYTIFTMACALAPNWPAFLIFRLLCGINASSPIAVVGGLYADIYGNPQSRGRAMAVFIGGTTLGPLIAPIISGFISPAKGWQWTFWVGLIIAGATWPLLLCLPETYGPVLLTRRAVKLRKSGQNLNVYAPMELENQGWKQLATVTLTRPVRMMCFELIVMASCLYLSVAYSIFYIFFEAYPVIFQGIYKQSSGVSGLMFLPISFGAFLSTGVFLYYDSFLLKAQKLNKPWTQKEESRRLLLACLGGPLYVISLFWIGWTASPSIPFWVPMLSGVPFGLGYVIIFMALLNYLTDAYEIFAASAMAASSCCRSIFGAALPFAAKKMYESLGVAWATSLLAFLSLAMCLVPFGFLWKGDAIRANSKFCIYLKEKKEKEFEEFRAQRENDAIVERLENEGTDEKV